MHRSQPSSARNRWKDRDFVGIGDLGVALRSLPVNPDPRFGHDIDEGPSVSCFCDMEHLGDRPSGNVDA
jgi:hypothetical protein